MVRYIEENEDEYPTIREPLPAAYLTLLVEGRLSHSFPLREEVKLGRDKTNGVVTADQKISRHHATFTPIDNTFIVTDQGSANGTYVNGVLISQPTRLKDKDKLRFGDTTFLFTTFPANSREIPGPAATPPAITPPPAPASHLIESMTIPFLSESNMPIWAVIGCMALVIIGLLFIVAMLLGVFVGRSQAGLLLMWWLG